MKVTFVKNVTIKDGDKLRMFRMGKVYDLNQSLAKRLAGLYVPVKQKTEDVTKVPSSSVQKQGQGRG